MLFSSGHWTAAKTILALTLEVKSTKMHEQLTGFNEFRDGRQK